MKCAVAWSGGKDSCFACFKAIRAGEDVRYLLNIVEGESGYPASHLINTEITKMQSCAIGIPLLQKRVASQRSKRAEFEGGVERFISESYKKGIKGMVVGYTHEDYQRLLLKRLASKYQIDLIENLFGVDPRRTLIEMVNAGFKAVITEVATDIISGDWIGRPADKEFIKYLSSLPDVDFCGDYGEYHTVVLDGPIFKKRVEIHDYNIIKQGKRMVLKINKCRLVDKK